MLSIWKVELEERWDYMEKHVPIDEFTDTDSNIYTVVASNYDEAIEKAKKVALSGSFADDENDKITYHCIAARLISIQKNEEIDA